MTDHPVQPARSLQPARVILGAIVGAVGWQAGFTLFFGPIQGYLGDPALQSAKFISMFADDPRPWTSEIAWLMPVALLVISLFYSIAYGIVRPALPGSGLKKGLLFGFLLFAIASTWFEFFTPFNLMREPLPLVALELVAWYLTMTAAGLAFALGHEWRRGQFRMVDGAGYDS